MPQSLRAPQTPFVPDDIPAPLAQALRRALDGATRRVQMIEAGGRRFWLKRPERLGLWWRLKKGDPMRSFQAERQALHDLHDCGMPVADLVAEDADYFLTADAGETLRHMLRDRNRTAADRQAAFRAAGRSLAMLHRAGLTHGRPSIRDICWDGRRATFIDLERFRPGPAEPRAMGLDLLLLVHSVFAVAGGGGPELDAALGAYATLAPVAAMTAARRTAQHLGWLRLLLRGVRRLHPSRDISAILPTLDRLTRTGGGTNTPSGGDPPHGQPPQKPRKS